MRRIDPRIWQMLFNHNDISGWPMDSVQSVDGYRKQSINGETKEFRLEDGRWVEVNGDPVDIGDDLKEVQSSVEELYDSIEEPTEEQTDYFEEAVDDIARLVDESS